MQFTQVQVTRTPINSINIQIKSGIPIVLHIQSNFPFIILQFNCIASSKQKIKVVQLYQTTPIKTMISQHWFLHGVAYLLQTI